MKRFLLAFGVLVAVCTASVRAQTSAEVAVRSVFLEQWFTVNQISLRLRQTGGEPTPDELRLFTEFRARMEGISGASVSGDSLGIVPLTDLVCLRLPPVPQYGVAQLLKWRCLSRHSVAQAHEVHTKRGLHRSGPDPDRELGDPLEEPLSEDVV